MIAYLLQCHGNYDFVMRLLGWLWRPEHSYIISINRDSDVPGWLYEKLKPLANVQIIHHTPIIWSGASNVATWLAVMQAFLNNGRQWDYFFNITGADIPLKSPEAMVETLTANARSGIQNYVGHFDITPEYIGFTDTPNKGAAEMLSLRADNKFIVHTDAARFFTERDVSPIMKTELRPGLYCAEMPGCGAHYVRPLYPFEIEARKKFFQVYPCRAGRGWVALHRSTCAWLQTNIQASFAYETMKTMFSAEELYFATLLNGTRDIAKTSIKNDNLRFHAGHPETLTDDFLPELQKDPAFFARKIELGAAPQTLEWVDFICPRHPGFPR